MIHTSIMQLNRHNLEASHHTMYAIVNALKHISFTICRYVYDQSLLNKLTHVLL
jgi:hypothetical protein